MPMQRRPARALGKLALGCAALALSGAAAAQSALDRATRSTQGESERPTAPATSVAPIPVDIADDAAPPPAASNEAPVAVGAIRLVGLKVLTPADFSHILGHYVGKECSTADLQALATRLTQRARARGYVLASATIAPQRLVAGVLAAFVDE